MSSNLKKDSNEETNKMVFDKINYQIMVVGILVISIGFIIMSMDTEPYGFGFKGITLGPMTVLLGFIIEFAAIVYKKKK